MFTLTRLTFTTADGTEYELRDTLTGGATQEVGCRDDGQPVFNRGKVFATADGTSATFISDTDIKDYTNGGSIFQPSGYLMFSSGLRYRISIGGVDWMRDRNGNQLKFTGTTTTKIVDSLDREVEIEYDVNDVAPYGHCDRITYKGFGGETRVIRISEAPMSTSMQEGETTKHYYELFDGMWGGLTYGIYDDFRVTAVWLPDGRSYKFRYNSYGEIGRIELPTGGAVEYDYGPGVAAAYGSGLVDLGWSGGDAPGDAPYLQQTIVRRAWVRREYPNGGTGASFARRTVYGGSGSSCGPDPESTVGVLHYKPNGTPEGIPVGGTLHWFYGSPCGSMQWAITNPAYSPPWKDGREFRTDSVAPDGFTVRRKVEMKWEQPAAGTTWPLTQPETNNSKKTNHPQVTQILTTLSDTGQVSKQTYSYDQYGNKTDVYEYDFGATAETLQLRRRTHTDFVSAAAYVGANVDPLLGPHLRSLPKETWVSADGGSTNKLSLTKFDYDQLALTPRANITGLCVTFPNAQCTPANPTSLVARGNPTGVTSYTNPAGGTGAITTTSAYDVAGNVVSMTDANGMSNPAGHTTQILYGDSFCNGAGCDDTFNPNTFAFVHQIKSPKPDPTNTYSSAADLTTTTVYDFWTGLVYSTTDANNQTTSFEYEGQPAKLDRVKAVMRPDGGRTDFNYGDTAGDLFVQTLTALDGTRTLESKRYFDGLGRVYRSATYENSVATQPWLNVDTEYDELGRARQVTMPYRSAGGGTPLTEGEWSNAKRRETTYDDLGRIRMLTTRPDNAAVDTDYCGDRVLVTDQEGKQRISKTDALGRLAEMWEVASNDPAKYPGVAAIPSEVTAGLPVTSAYGYRTEYFYDAPGNLRRVKQGTQQRFFAYDSLGRLVRAKNLEQGNFTPDGAGGDFPALTDNTSGENNGDWSTGYVYDANGNLTKRKDARNVIAAYGYDALNRNITVTYTTPSESGAATTPDVRRYYDNPANGMNGKGKPWWTETVGVSANVFDTYDAMGRPTQYHQTFWTGTPDWGTHFNVSLAYDKSGNVISQTYPSLHTVAYSYDAAGRTGDNGQLPAFKGNLGDGGAQRTYASQVLYDELGGMSQERLGTDTPVYNKRFYNVRGQLADIRVSTHPITSTDPNLKTNWNRGAILNHYSQAVWGGSDQYNNGNLRTQQVWVPTDDSISGWSLFEQAYTYDALNRLRSVSEGGQWRQEYDYDRWGNRTINAAGTWLGQPSATPSDSVNEKQFDVGDLPNTNRLYAPGDLAYPDPDDTHRKMRYDAAGNLKHDSHTGAGNRTYDAENRMTAAADKDGGTTNYAYDGNGRRVKRMVGTPGEVWQVYGAGGELLAEYAPNAATATPRKEYGYRGGELLVTAEPAAAGWGPPPTFTGPDPLSTGHTIKRENLTELRSAVNQLRQHAGLAPYNFTADPNPAQYVTTAKAEHIRQLRAALEGALSQLGLPTGGYEHPTLTENSSLIYAIDFQELREQIRGAWQNGSAGVDLRWLVTDQLGTPRMVLDKTGSLTGVSRHDYLPFGEELSAEVGGRQSAPGYGAFDKLRQQFASKERDFETGLNYFGARYYNSTLGRFTGVDPALESARGTSPQSWNRYAYAFNNPLRYIDPLGLWTYSIEYEYWEEGKKKGQLKSAKLIFTKSNDKDDAASLLKQLGFKPTDKGYDKLLGRVGAALGSAGSIQSSNLGGELGNFFGIIESKLKDQKEHVRKNPNDKGGPGDPDYQDCSMTSCRLAFPMQMAMMGAGGIGVVNFDVQKADDLLGQKPKAPIDDLRVGDIIRYGKDTKRHFANFIFMGEDGIGVIFSRTGARGRFETLTINEPMLIRDYGKVTGSFRGPDLTK